jgi:hypothetical protein
MGKLCVNSDSIGGLFSYCWQGDRVAQQIGRRVASSPHIPCPAARWWGRMVEFSIAFIKRSRSSSLFGFIFAFCYVYRGFFSLLNSEERESSLGCLGSLIVFFLLTTLGVLVVLYMAGQLPWLPWYATIFDLLQ